MSHDSLRALIRLALILSFASSLIGLIAGLVGEDEDRKDDKNHLEEEIKLRNELNELHKEIDQLKAKISNG
ncbi:hypothetical protein [Pelosinus sp. IPA-1]|uniref:hypothetical protein n=1 Tax=Pelosinus sp. IPA-1 TaxID=3029569 RepID=UPI0024362AFF|nr:hypothetical protein [Pelosinus sp. IPA-1]GMB01124.1 hypothetical protein PIPA1_39230 [Pelosinus sp. IPA-1]